VASYSGMKSTASRLQEKHRDRIRDNSFHTPKNRLAVTSRHIAKVLFNKKTKKRYQSRLVMNFLCESTENILVVFKNIAKVKILNL
jgi:hypothetical protein